MERARKKELGLLLCGDIVFFVFALWLTLLVRYQALPDYTLFMNHLVPFFLLFIGWITVFFIAGLYDKHTVLLKKHLPSLIITSQFINIGLAGLFFFLIPYFGITPKTNLAIYLVLSSVLIILWRLYLYPIFWNSKRHKALILGNNPEIAELVEEVNANTRYDFAIVHVVDFETVRQSPDVNRYLLELIDRDNISLIIADSQSEQLEPFLPLLFNLTFLDIRFSFLELSRVYEDTFDRVALSMLRYSWFLEHVPQSPRKLYDLVKRGIDIVGGFLFGLVTLLVTPLVWMAMRFEDRGPLFIEQKRIGQYNAPLTVYKFRTMTHNKSASAEWTTEEKETNKVTKIGAFLRKTSIDELPQSWNILKGDMSLIGPRNDISGLGTRLAEAIPYYTIRYTVRPGITGWAQTHQAYAPGQISPQSIEETKVRLAYDLYYIKHCSLFLDLSIALRTVKTLLSRFGVTISMK